MNHRDLKGAGRGYGDARGVPLPWDQLGSVVKVEVQVLAAWKFPSSGACLRSRMRTQS